MNRVLLREILENCWEAWDKLKRQLCLAPTLAFLDFSREFVLYVDGSKQRGFGAALHQAGADGVEQPVLFLSKVLLKHEQNYWLMELKVAVLVWSLHKLQQYLDLGHIVVYTDHKVIKGLFNSSFKADRQHSTCLNNWQLFLLKYTHHMEV